MLGHPLVTDTFDVLIVGAGIIGAACAAECARGGLKVLVLERESVGGGTTASGMGHLVVMDDSDAQFALTSYSRGLWNQLAPSLPPDVEYDSCGTLWVAADESEMVVLQQKEQSYRSHGVKVERLDGPALREAEPNLRRDLVGGLRVVEDAVIYPPCAARFLLDDAKSFDLEVRTGCSVREIADDGAVLLDDGTRICSGICVNAAGCDSPSLTPGLPVRKRKGHLVITDRYPGYVKHQVIELGYLKSAHTVSTESVAFNIQPRKTGQMLIGSSRQFEADNTAVDHAVLAKMLRRAAHFLPTIGNLSAIRVWTGHRAATPDKLPLIGPGLTSDRLWLATGHEGLGITTSLGTGRLLADMILHRASDIPVEPYLPARLTAGDPQHG